MTFAHNHVMVELGYLLRSQLDPVEFHVCINAGHVRRSGHHYYIPDVFVVPARTAQAPRELAYALEVYADPLPLVVEVWSPSTGAYDIDEKVPEYQRRGDTEIWRIHPYERTLTAWRRQPDGGYTETLFTKGAIEPVALPGVRIVLAELFT